MKYLITLLGRGGSQGVPSKNIKLLDGKPMIYYSIQAARELQNLIGAHLELSTDSAEIIRVAKECGLSTDYIRPAELANPTISKKPALEHLLNHMETKNGITYDYVIDFDITSPLRKAEDIVKALELIESDQNALNLITVSAAARNPYFNMVEKKSNGYYHVCKQPDKPFYSRQDAPQVFDMNSNFYLFKRKYFDSEFKGTFTDRTMIYTIDEICFDIDRPLDFEIMEFIMRKRRLEKTKD